MVASKVLDGRGVENEQRMVMKFLVSVGIIGYPYFSTFLLHMVQILNSLNYKIKMFIIRIIT